ncbi:hypothetical protein TBLA_0D02300 [Henningerozyma blattae CBS 6284]|uniref:C2H2-type domain-containing protein n=1 Tax=Henningerozyma blattae (strain ATCC 34711 / CBS 6284 / DSM 70876 / NBRC 10599 / NRRL Y-10934 / UCD 77-7) TaxID=1071380 RepID=I2H2Y2_HENB6|nr:hypothetical protein TBLA_0D02300 [Tetrapisispora blattae CBS 6284]CCH60734.1 hypothetical protein TBLA_0D02300 [Tetrapisispora blattae CBS 6284]
MTTIKENNRFACPHPDCNKSFSRQEHLSRHKLNHWPKKIYKCTYVISRKKNDLDPSNTEPTSGDDDSLNVMICNKTFVRKDLLVRHERRHFRRRKSSTNTNSSTNNTNSPENTGIKSNSNSISPSLRNTNIHHNNYSFIKDNPVDPQGPILSDLNDMFLLNTPFFNLDPLITFRHQNTLNNKINASNTVPVYDENYNNNLPPPLSNRNPSQTQLNGQSTSSPTPFSSNSSNFSQHSNSNSNNNALNSNPTLTSELIDDENSISNQINPSLTNSTNIINLDTSMAADNNNPNQNLLDENDNPYPFAPELSNSKNELTDQILEGSNEGQNNNSNEPKIDPIKLTPNFFHADGPSKYFLSDETKKNLVTLIPDIKSIAISDLRKSVKSYWRNFHPQFSFLHKPSFHIDNAPQILILAMIMTGASFLGPEFRHSVSDTICGPLRWIIFTHQDFQPPSATYIIQSLLLLETYEKFQTNRYLHERSHIHHGTTIQLLRRTPVLNDNPEKFIYTQDIDNNNLQEIFHKWINYEMLKRVALYAFYIDTTHAVIFGYSNLFITYNQIHLSLPCADDIWEDENITYETLITHDVLNESRNENCSYLYSLKKLFVEAIAVYNHPNRPIMHNDWNIKSLFGKKLLLAGIISIMFQCQFDTDMDLFTFVTHSYKDTGYNRNAYQEGDLENMKINSNSGTSGISPSPSSLENMSESSFNEDSARANWKEIISFAINYWFCRIQRSCTTLDDTMFLPSKVPKVSDLSLLKPSIYADGDTNDGSTMEPSYEFQFPDYDNADDTGNVNLLDMDDNSCKLSVYHMSQIILRIFHYDYYIYAGAPWRMSVKLQINEYETIRSRVQSFASNPDAGGVAMIYALNLMFELLLVRDPVTQNFKLREYDINADCCIPRPNSLGNITLLIWSYNFVLYGPEAQIWDNSEVTSTDPNLTTTHSTLATLCSTNNLEKKEAYKPTESVLEYLSRLYPLLKFETTSDTVKFHRDVKLKALALQKIPGKNNMCGLIKYIRDLFLKSYWELGREFGRLLDNCFERSLGRSTITCHTMFETV